jgi:excisionase family DNA binding protein
MTINELRQQPSRLLTIGDVSELLGVKIATVENWITRQEIPHYALPSKGKRFLMVRIDSVEFIAWLDNLHKIMSPEVKPAYDQSTQVVTEQSESCVKASVNKLIPVDPEEEGDEAARYARMPVGLLIIHAREDQLAADELGRRRAKERLVAYPK